MCEREREKESGKIQCEIICELETTHRLDVKSEKKTNTQTNRPNTQIFSQIHLQHKHTLSFRMEKKQSKNTTKRCLQMKSYLKQRDKQIDTGTCEREREAKKS